MSLDYIRNAYGVPAYRGARIKYRGNSVPQLGTVRGAEDAHIIVLLDGEKRPRRFHPVWRIEYLQGGGDSMVPSKIA